MKKVVWILATFKLFWVVFICVHVAISLNSLDYNIIMERFLKKGTEYGPAPTAGSSSGADDQLKPERSYGTDLRYLDKEEKYTASRADTDNKVGQRRVEKFLNSARAAERYKQESLIDEPQVRGRTPRTNASIKGVNVPTLGDRVGIGGSVNYARKPESNSGTFRKF